MKNYRLSKLNKIDEKFERLLEEFIQEIEEVK